MSTKPYLTFASAEPFTFKWSSRGVYWDGSLEWSTDTSLWVAIQGSQQVSSAEHEGEQRIYLRGAGNTVISNGAGNFVLGGNNIRCTGNIETLLDYETVQNGEHPTMGLLCFAYLFKNCTGLTEAPELPATTLGDSCYTNMFKGCTSLTKPPVLPATVLTSICYQGMFDGCTGIKLSTVQTEEYWKEYRIPTTGVGDSYDGKVNTLNSALQDMFANTGGTFTGTPEINTVYYIAAPKDAPDEEETTVDYTISYFTAHGSAPNAKAVTVNEGESYALTAADLPILEAEGYTFKGWTANGTDILSVGDTISADVTLTAVWEEIVPEMSRGQLYLLYRMFSPVVFYALTGKRHWME